MSHDEFDTLLATYAVAAIDGDDLVRLEAHLAKGCAQCEAALAESDATLAQLAVVGPRAIPPAHVRQALLARLAATTPRRRPTPRQWIPWVAGVAAAMLVASLLTAGFVAGRYEARLGEMARQTTAARERLAAQDAVLRQQLRVHASMIEMLRDPATRVVTMRGTGSHREAIGRVVWNDRSGGHVFVANLPPPPQGKTYEMWMITGATARPAGLFSTDAAGKGSHVVPATSNVEAFAVTLEPAGGMPAPTGPTVVASTK
jgi:anti-sigma-K factor RskA